MSVYKSFCKSFYISSGLYGGKFNALPELRCVCRSFHYHYGYRRFCESYQNRDACACTRAGHVWPLWDSMGDWKTWHRCVGLRLVLGLCTAVRVDLRLLMWNDEDPIDEDPMLYWCMMWNDEDPIDEDPMTQLIFGVESTVMPYKLYEFQDKTAS